MHYDSTKDSFQEVIFKQKMDNRIKMIGQRKSERRYIFENHDNNKLLTNI